MGQRYNQANFHISEFWTKKKTEPMLNDPPRNIFYK